MKQFTAVIIDDELSARTVLNQMLIKYPEIQVVGEADNIIDGRKMFMKISADVAFLDVMLGHDCGFDLVPHIPKETAIVFFTGYQTYAAQAFDVNALDFLIKPFNGHRLEMAVRKIKDRYYGLRYYHGKSHPQKKDQHVCINAAGGITYIALNTVAAVKSIGGNYTVCCLVSGDKYTIRKTLKEWLKILPENQFFRSHRSTIINIEQIDNLIKKKSSMTWSAYLNGLNEPAAVSCRKVSALKALLLTAKN